MSYMEFGSPFPEGSTPEPEAEELETTAFTINENDYPISIVYELTRGSWREETNSFKLNINVLEVRREHDWVLFYDLESDIRDAIERHFKNKNYINITYPIHL